MLLSRLDAEDSGTVSHGTIDTISKMISLFKDLRGGLRQVELQAISEKLLKHINGVADAFLELKTLELGTGSCSQASAEIVMAGLDLFSQVPGVLSTLSEFKKWMARNSSRLFSNDLLSLIISGKKSASDIDFQKVKRMTERVAGGEETPHDLLLQIPGLVRAMLDACLTQEQGWAEE